MIKQHISLYRGSASDYIKNVVGNGGKEIPCYISKSKSTAVVVYPSGFDTLLRFILTDRINNS